MKDDFILALDQGTTSSRAILFNSDGAIHKIAQEEFRQIFPQSGWVEHDPFEILKSQMGTLNRVISESGVTPSKI